MPSMVNGRPQTSPKSAMRPGQRMPSSKLRMVPETAPTAKRTAKAWDQRRARRRATGSSWRRLHHSASRTKIGKPTPKQAMTMCQPSESAICWRAANRSTASAAKVMA